MDFLSSLGTMRESILFLLYEGKFCSFLGSARRDINLAEHCRLTRCVYFRYYQVRYFGMGRSRQYTFNLEKYGRSFFLWDIPLGRVKISSA